MFTITKTERDRQQYVRAVRRIASEVFNIPHVIAGHDQAWRTWLTFKKRECSDLRELVKADVNDVFRARAIAILLAPDLKLAPYAWYDRTSLDNYMGVGSGFSLTDLSPRLRQFVLALLEINIDIALTPSVGDVVRWSLLYYNRYILQALAMLPANDQAAARLFGRYQINDPVVYGSAEDASGYNPFYEILHADIPEKWKRLADDAMREVIHAEQVGEAQPRADHENAVKCYVRHIEMCLYSKPFPYNPALFASQVDFIIRQSEPFQPHHVRTILALLAGENYKEVRHRFARYMTFVSHDGRNSFWVHDDGTRAAATLMLDEFGDCDPELGESLRQKIAEGDERAQARKLATEMEQKQANTVLAQMR